MTERSAQQRVHRERLHRDYAATVPMLGGAQAIREPWRNALAHWLETPGWERVLEEHGDLEIVRYLAAKPLGPLRTMAEKGLNSPLASSAGRLFDAAVAAVGVCRDQSGFEGQAAIELEALAAGEFVEQAASAYGF